MTFSLAALALLTIAGFFILSGMYHGFIRTAGSLVGLVGGAVVASWIINRLSETLALGEHPVWTIVFFIIILALCAQLIGWIFVLVDRAYKLLSIIPFLSSINKLLGGLIGLIEAVVIIAAIGYAAQTYLSEGAFQAAILGSQVMSWLSVATGVITWIVSLVL